MNTMKILKDSYHVMTKEMIELKRDKMTIAGMVVMPLIFLLLFGFIFPSGSTHENVQMGLVNLDQGAGSNEFITQMETINNQLATSKNSSYMSFTNYPSVDAAKQLLIKEK